MVGVEHTGDTVETESIKLVLLHPETKIAQEEPEHFMVSIVEQTTIPLVVTALTTLMEVQVISAIELIDTIRNILRSMAVHHIKQNNQAHAMRSINELLQILRGPIATASSKEVVHLVTETGVVRMLHNGHQLDSIVAQTLNARQHVLRELFVSGHPCIRGRDTNVSLVDTQALGLLGPAMLEGVALVGGRVPEYSVVYRGDVQVLDDSLDPGWDSVDTLAAGENHCDLIGMPCKYGIEGWNEICGSLTLILLSWGIAGAPPFAGTVTFHTPKSSLVIVLALTSQESASLNIDTPNSIVSRRSTY